MKSRILIVDDEREVLETLSQRLSIREYDVTTAFSGKEAIETLKVQNFDVVILDVLMPGMDGVETLREIKRMKPLTEVIMLTGNTTVEVAVEGMKLGAHDTLTKPCETKDLISKVDKAYERKAEQEERIRAVQAADITS
jgi:DNA-binding NtrC family response regulator